MINIDGQIDLSISKTISSNIVYSNHGSTQEIISRNIDSSLRLLLLQHHKFNLWKDRAKILSSNHKIQQLLLLLNESSHINNTTNNVTTSTNNSINSNNNNNNINNNNNNTVNNNNIPNSSNGNVGNTIGTNNSISSPNTNISAIPTHRARASLPSHSQLTCVLPKEIPILLPIMSLTRFWVQFDRIRHVIHSVVSPFSGNGGLTISVHFKFHDPLLSKPSNSKLTYDAYPGNSEIALSLGISILKG